MDVKHHTTKEEDNFFYFLLLFPHHDDYRQDLRSSYPCSNLLSGDRHSTDPTVQVAVLPQRVLLGKHQVVVLSGNLQPSQIHPRVALQAPVKLLHQAFAVG